MRTRTVFTALAAVAATLALAAPAAAEPTLRGRAILPSDAYQPGPPSGAAITADNGVTIPFPSQPVPGFSAVLNAGDGVFWAMPDNGYGAKGNSADFLLRIYRIRPHFKTADGGSGAVDVLGFRQLRDPDGHVPFALTRSDRLLTGADFDLESVRRAEDGTFWFGEEFGPFLLHTDASGRVLEAPIPLPGVQSPQNPFLPSPDAWTIRASRGFEPMALSADGERLYPMLEGALRNDSDKRRRIIHEFDLDDGRYTGRTWAYRTDAAFPDAVIGDMTAIDQHRFLVIERDDDQGAGARQKRIYRIDLRRTGSDGALRKTLVLDLLRIRDPDGVSLPARPGEFGVGDPFSFPLQSVESLEVLGGRRLLIANDNNYPFSDGRWTARDRPDDVELIVVDAPRLRSDPPEPLVIGHRGASGYLPDHTLEGYALAVRQGADFIEPDLVATKDGHLIARHEPNILSTTDVASHPEFASRRRTAVVDGASEEGFFASDFTLAEIKTLRAVQPLAERPQEFNGRFRIPTLDEVLALARRAGRDREKPVGVYPETKHPSYHQRLGLALEDRLVRALRRAGLNRADAKVFIQSFEQANLRRLNEITPVRLVQLVDANDVNPDGSLDYAAPFDRPYDWTASGDPQLLARTYGFFATDAGLAEIATYADGVGPWKRYIVSTAAQDIDGDGTVGDENGDGLVNEADRRALPPTDLIDRAHAHGLVVHTWTFRNEKRRLAFDYDGDPSAEYAQFFELGIDGVFSDFPDTALAARRQFTGG